MKVSDALQQRKSTRAFLDKAVDEALIRKVLTSAAHAPSGVNSQPWQVAVLSGAKKRDLQSKMEAAFRGGQKGKMDYSYYPNEWISPYKDRRKECGLLMYSTLEITREDKERQLDQWAANYRAFDAPTMLLFFMEDIMEAGSFMDFGMFLQSVMLSAMEEGLATCPQAALGEYPDIVRKELGYPDNAIVMCGMAIGYEDESALVNSYRTSREDIDVFTKFYR
ncbi:MAG: nitroreductase [Arenicella sp.]